MTGPCGCTLASSSAIAPVQSVPAHEIIVVNDGSTDGTGAIADELASVHPQVQVIHQQNGGPAAARNAAIAAATGEFLTFLDADDAMVPSRIESQVGYLLTHPDTDIVIGSVERISEGDVGNHVEFLRHEQIAEDRAKVITIRLMPLARSSAICSCRRNSTWAPTSPSGIRSTEPMTMPVSGCVRR